MVRSRSRERSRDRYDRSHRRSSPQAHEGYRRRGDGDNISREETSHKRRRYSSDSTDDYRRTSKLSRGARPSDHKRVNGGRQRPPSRSESRSRSPRPIRRTGPLPSQALSFSAQHTTDPDLPPAEPKQQPNFAPTGLLAKEANTIHTTRPSAQTNNHNTTPAPQRSRRAVVLKYHEPPEARKPPTSQPWRLFHFSRASKADEMKVVDTLSLGERSCWLFGTETGVVDVLLDSDRDVDGPRADGLAGQHAVIQFRHSASRDEFGDRHEKIRPYLLDLETGRGTRLNRRKVETGRFVELRDADVIRFGDARNHEWVLMLPPEDRG